MSRKKKEILTMSFNFNVLKNLQNMFVPLYNNCQPYVNIKTDIPSYKYSYISIHIVSKIKVDHKKKK